MKEMRPLGDYVELPVEQVEAMHALRGLDELPFPPEDYQHRQLCVLRRMAGLAADALIVWSASSVEYLCGFRTGAAVTIPVVLLHDRILLFLPVGELPRAAAGSYVDEALYYGPRGDGVQLLARELARRLGSGGRVAVDLQRGGPPPVIVERLRNEGLSVVDAGYAVEQERLRLSPRELDYVAQAAQRTALGWRAAQTTAAESNVTDSELAGAIFEAMIAASDSVPRNVYVATGWRGGVTHSTWSHATVDRSTSTFLEFSGGFRSYCAPVMRTLVYEDASAQVNELARLAETGLSAVLATLRPGITGAEVASHAMKALGALPPRVVFHENFGYPVGTSRGITWSDGAPFFLRSDNHEVVEERMVFHIPMSFRLLGKCGVGLSHTVAVEPGGPRILTSACGPARLVKIP